MADGNKKRSNSFRKLFPSLFFSHKSKEKVNKDSSCSLKSSRDSSPKRNQYENPRSANVRSESHENDGNNEWIYENLVSHHSHRDNEMDINEIPSNHSSSSTLVSESVIKIKGSSPSDGIDTMLERENELVSYVAKPQVPPKPQNELGHSFTKQNTNHNLESPKYPDVYYHSLEKLSDKISPLDEMEIFKASQTHSNPASVGAEIKKVSTKFIISPKKEAEVRTIQPTRARSLSFDKQKPSDNKSLHTKTDTDEENMKKPYNYSAPTSPIPTTYKIPSIPKTVSPYEHVRKTLIEAEERRNSLSRSSFRNKSTPSPRLQENNERSKTPTPTSQRDSKEDLEQKEKARQKVEAFYWQKLKELKDKEDEYFLRQSIPSSMRNSLKYNTSYSNSNSSTPNSNLMETRSYSLPRGNDANNTSQPIYSQIPFIRGTPERRTDTFLHSRSSYGTTDIVYRHPEKLYARTTSPIYATTDRKQTPIFQRGSLTRDISSTSQQPKRVSFEEQYSSKVDDKSVSANFRVSNENYERINMKNELRSANDTLKVNDTKGAMKGPPRPPVRTSSVGKSYKLTNNKKLHHSLYSESESGSEAGEVQTILQINAKKQKEEDWQGDGSRTDAGGLSDGESGRPTARGRASRRDDPRRHTLAGNHLYMQPHHPGPFTTIDIERYGPGSMNAPEYATVSKYRDMKHTRILDPRTRKPPLPRSYPPPSNNLLFDDDPGIMSEVETASTGFRRGGKQRSSLPVVRTPSKTLERPLGLVFLQYRNETKRALLPNEITSIDTVKALFVRSFPKQLTMQYMDSPMVKIYIHDSSKDMFYELEDMRAHLRDIRDRSVLRLFEATDMGGGVFPGAVGVGSLVMPAGAATCSGPSSWEQDQSYFSEPEIDSDYHLHAHKTKVKAPAYYMGTPAPSTLPRGGSMLRAFSPAAPPVPADRVKTLPGAGHGGEGYMSSPERGAARVPYEDPYYTQFLPSNAARPTITPVIDEETSDSVIIDDSYQMYGVNPITTAPRPMPRPPYDTRINSQVEDMQRLRVEKMERQLANLTGLVQKALQVPGSSGATPAVAPRQEFQTYQARPASQDAAHYASDNRPPKLGREKFQRDRLKPAPPPKPVGLVGQHTLVHQRTYTLNVSPDFFNQLRVLQKQSRDLRIETRNLRRSTLSHAIQMRQMMSDTIMKIGALAANFYENDPDSQLSREEEIYRQDMLLLENDLYELEATVERLRGQAANRETRVNMADIERIAMGLSKASKTVAEWKLRLPLLQNTMKARLASEMERVVRKEKILEEEPERLELALRRCKKLTGTLVTLKRLACVQEQRLPLSDGRLSPGSSSSTFGGPSSEEFTSDSTCHLPAVHNKIAGHS